MVKNKLKIGLIMFKDKIKELREARKLTQEEIALSIGTTKTTYIKYEKGTQSPQLVTVEKIAEFYGIPVKELISEVRPSIDEQLQSKLNSINNLNTKEKESIIMMIEGILFRHQNIELCNIIKTAQH